MSEIQPLPVSSIDQDYARAFDEIRDHILSQFGVPKEVVDGPSLLTDVFRYSREQDQEQERSSRLAAALDDIKDPP